MTVTIPTAPDELEEMLGDDKQLKAIYEAGSLGEFIKNYANTVHKKDPALGQQIEIEVQRTMAQWLTDQKEAGLVPLDLTGAAVTAAVAKSRRIRVENNGQILNVVDPRGYDGPGKAADGKFASAADYWQAVGNAGFKNGRGLTPDQDRKLTELEGIRNSYGSTVPADGGFLIPDLVREEILMIALEDAVVRPRATVVPMSSLRLGFPAVDVTTNNGSLYGGVTAAWTEEAAVITESQGSFEKIQLDAKKLAAFAGVPNELFDDAPAFRMWLDQAFPTAIAWYEDLAFFQGTGVGEPLGFLNAPAIVTVAKESGQAASTIVWENVVKMYARMLPSSLARAVWIVSPDTFPELATMALSVGTGGSAVWLNQGQSGPPATILGRPVIISEKAKSLTNQGDINFVDLSYYLIGDRMAMQASASEHFYFNQDKMAFRVIERVDGRPWIQSAVTPQNSGSTLSPFVNLAAR